jgi:EpsI family protein
MPFSQKIFDATSKTRLIKIVMPMSVYILLISVAPLSAGYVMKNVNSIATINVNGIKPIGGWSGPLLYTSNWEMNYLLYSDRYRAGFSKNDHNILLNSYLYTKENSKGELINVNNTLVVRDKWSVVNNSIAQRISLNNVENSFSINKATIQSKVFHECRRVWYWFEVNDEIQAQRWKVKLNESIMQIKGKSGSLITSISTNCSDNAERILEEFLTDNLMQVRNIIAW